MEEAIVDFFEKPPAYSKDVTGSKMKKFRHTSYTYAQHLKYVHDQLWENSH